MKKFIYFLLLIVTTAFGAYTVLYMYKKQHEASPILTATSTEVMTTTNEEQATSTLRTKTGKYITVTETKPLDGIVSTITITPSLFANNTPIVLEKNKLNSYFLADLNNDSFDELIIVTTTSNNQEPEGQLSFEEAKAQGLIQDDLDKATYDELSPLQSQKYSQATIFTTKGDTELTEVTVPTIGEEDTQEGALFEGYMGDDTFAMHGSDLVHEFKKVSQESSRGSVIYTLTGTSSAIVFSKPEKAVAKPQ